MHPAAAQNADAVARLDRLMLTSLLVVGGLWLLPSSRPWVSFEAAAFSLVVAAYVLGGSLAMASLYAREVITMKQEVWTLVVLWVVAVALWTGIWISLGVKAERDPNTLYLVNGMSVTDSICAALLMATPCFLAWQLPALAIRVLWRRRRLLARPA